MTDKKLSDNQRERFIVLQEIVSNLTPFMTPEEAYQRIFEELKRVVSFDTATFFFRYGDKIQASAAKGFPPDEEKEVLKLSFTLENKGFKEMDERKVPIIVNDVKKIDYLEAKVATKFTKSWIGIPLITKGVFIGAITLDKHEPNFYTEEDFEITRHFSAIAAMTLSNSLLFHQRELLVRASLKLNQAVSLEDTLHKTLDEVLKIVGGEEGAIFILDEDKKMMRIVVSKGIPKEVVSTLNREGVSVNRGSFALVFNSKEIVEIKDAYQDPRVAKVLWNTPQNILNVPLISEEEIVGILSMDSLPRNEEERKILRFYASLAGSVVKKVSLLEKYEKLTTDLQIISSVSKNLSSFLEREELFRKTAEFIRKNFKLLYLSIYLVDKLSNELVYTWGAGFRWEKLKGTLRFKPGGPGIVAYVAEKGEPLLASDVKKHPRYYHIEELSRGHSQLAVPIKARGELLGVLDLRSEEINAFGNQDILTFQTLADQLGIALENAFLYQELKNLAITDGLTGLYNHRKFYEILDEEMERLSRHERYLSVMFIDIDGFKKYNDTYGHLEGDKLLKKVAKLLIQGVRKVDKVARYGGDEFAVLLPYTHLEGAKMVASRTRMRALKNNISLSIGLASIYHGTSISKEDFLRAADTALYQAKKIDGRIEVWSELRNN